MKIAKTPELNTESHFIATDYKQIKTDSNAFGAANAKALGTVAKGLSEITAGADRIQEQQEYISILDAANKIDDLRNNLLNDKENGYLNKKGSDAAGKAKDVIANFDTSVEKIKNAYNLSSTANARLEYMINGKRNAFVENANSHDIQQTAAFGKTVCETSMTNNISNLMSNRNNPNALGQFKKDTLSIVNVYKNQANLSDEQVKSLIDGYFQKAVSSLIGGYQSDNNLDMVREIYTKYGNALSPDVQAEVQATLTAYDTKIWADNKAEEILKLPTLEEQYAEIDKEKDLLKRSNLLASFQQKKGIADSIEQEKFKNKVYSLSENILKLYPDEESQLNAAYQIEDIDERDSVIQRIKHHNSELRRLKNQKEDELLTQFYQTVLEKEKTGETLSMDDIPQGLSPEKELSARRYVSQTTANGDVTTDDRVWEYLYKKQVSDAQGFAKLNLDVYRGFLSKDEYKTFVKAQENIKQGGYYTDFNNQKLQKKIQEMMVQVDIDNHWNEYDNEIINYDIIKYLANEYEARTANKIPEEKLQGLISSMGYEQIERTEKNGKIKEKKLPRTYKKVKPLYYKYGTQILKKFANDIAYFETVHSRFPNEQEIDDIVNSNVKNFRTEMGNELKSKVGYTKTRDLVFREIQNISAKPNYSKSLTYLENKVIPQWEQELGVKITVVDGGTYRNYVKPGSSHHHEIGGYSRAIDISTSEHSKQTVYEITRKALLNPAVEHIGTSDPNLLRAFPTSAYPKIVDERSYDKKHGTNHVHHLHLTLISDKNENYLKVKK